MLRSTGHRRGHRCRRNKVVEVRSSVAVAIQCEPSRSHSGQGQNTDLRAEKVLCVESVYLAQELVVHHFVFRVFFSSGLGTQLAGCLLLVVSKQLRNIVSQRQERLNGKALTEMPPGPKNHLSFLLGDMGRSRFRGTRGNDVA